LAVAASAGVGVAVLGAAISILRVARVEAVTAVLPEASYEWTRSRGAWLGRRMRLTLVACGSVAGAVCLWLASSAPGRDGLAVLTLGLWLAVTVLAMGEVVPFGVRMLKSLCAWGLGPLPRLAFDGLLRSVGRLALTTAATAITVGLVVAIGAANDSYRAEFMDRIALAFGAPLYVEPRANDFNA